MGKATVKKRNSQDFPAAGLRWNVVLNKGENKLSVVGKKVHLNEDGAQRKDEVKDSVTFQYQTEKWGKPSKLLMEKITEENGVATIQAKLLDEKKKNNDSKNKSG